MIFFFTEPAKLWNFEKKNNSFLAKKSKIGIYWYSFTSQNIFKVKKDYLSVLKTMKMVFFIVMTLFILPTMIC
ncbi:hypothetical protein CGC49_04305 [Capnocytophaga sp. H4358]|nr:hypothetical protein CGC49_04305 [Capnocytophaga sp. H4358]